MSTATVTTTPFVQKWLQYRDTRSGTYEFRSSTRYKAVVDLMERRGLRDGDVVVDVGAGECQFGKYLRERGFDVAYQPIDAVLDGTDLERWSPHHLADFYISIEVLEHLHHPWRLAQELPMWSQNAAIITTPNPDTVDVIGCDPTHVSVLSIRDFEERGWYAEPISLFHQPDDSIIAYTGEVNVV